MRFNTKIAIVVREDLAAWQKLNLTAFLSSGLGTMVPEVIGEPYRDASGNCYLPMFRQPVLVTPPPTSSYPLRTAVRWPAS